MLRGLRTAIQYFTLGLALGLLLAPRKGDETRSLLIDQIRTYVQEAFSNAQSAMSGSDHHPDDSSHTAYSVDGAYNASTTSGVQ